MEKILIVDDDRKIRRIYAALLKSEGFKVAEASDAHSANEILNHEEINLTLLDIKMPEVDGGIMYEIIQAFHQKSKVIVTSVYPLDDQKNLIAGANDYYDKSLGIEILLNKIKKVLKDESKKNSNH